MLPNLSGIMSWVRTISQLLSWHRRAQFVNDEGILVDDEGILVDDEGILIDDEEIFAKFSVSTKEFLWTTKEFLQNFHQKYEGIE